MTCLGSRIPPGAAALAVAIACCATPLLAQSADADPADMPAAAAADRSDATPAPIDATPVAPFAEVHPTYVPSRSAVDDRLALDSIRKPRPVKRASADSEPTIARATAPAPVAAPPVDVPAVDTPADTETPPAVDTPAVTMPRQVAPATIDRTTPAPTPAGVTLTDSDFAQLLAAGAAAAILLAGAGFALGRRSGRRANFAGAVAKTPTWQAVMPPDLTATDEEPVPESDQPVAKSPGKRVKRGGLSDHAGPTAARGTTSRTTMDAGARGSRVVQL